MNKKLHDSFCRGVLSHVPTFLELVHYLTTIDNELKNVVDLLDENSFVRIPGDYSNTETIGYADLAFLAKLKNSLGSPVQLSVGFLLEHKSYPDNSVMTQLRKYNYHLMFEHMAENAGKGIPSIAIILYNGREIWNPLTNEVAAYPKELQKFMLPFKGMMLDVEDVSDDAVEQFGPRLAALICSLKYARNPEANRATFSHIVDRVHTELPKEDSLDILRQMDVYLNGWIHSEFKEILKMDFVRPPYKTVADAIREEAIEETTASVTASVTESVSRAAIIKALMRGKLTLQEIAEDNSVSVNRVHEIQAEMQKS